MRDKLWGLLERSMTKVILNGKQMHGWCFEFTPWFTLKKTIEGIMSQTSLDRYSGMITDISYGMLFNEVLLCRFCFVSMAGGMYEDDILDNRMAVEESCRQDFVAFLKMLLVLPSARHDLVPILLIWRKVVLWLQSIHNCLFRGIQNLQFYCVNHATSYQSDHRDFIKDSAEDFSLNASIPYIVAAVGNFFCERLFTSERRSFASDLEKLQSVDFQDCPLFPVAGKNVCIFGCRQCCDS
jgi:hypothetical protein